MTTNQARAEALVQALRAGVTGDRTALVELYTDDVRAWTPSLSASSRDDLLDELERRDAAFSDVELATTPLDVGGDYAAVEWTVSMTHTGPLTLAGDQQIDATGTRVTVHGVTVAEFRDGRICSLRQYWDEFEVLDQLELPG